MTKLSNIVSTLNNVEDYITTTINGSYSPLTITKLVSYDKQQNAFVGMIECSNGISYTFYISQTDGLPMLKPVLDK